MFLQVEPEFCPRGGVTPERKLLFDSVLVVALNFSPWCAIK